MKLSLSSISLAAALFGAAEATGPSVQIENTAYVGNDLGVACEALGEKRIVQKKGSPVVFCFNVKNTGDTYLTDFVLTNDKFDFFDNSIALLAPGASKMVTFQSKIEGNVDNTVRVTCFPAMADRSTIVGASQVEASDLSIVVDPEVAIQRRRQLVDDVKATYAADEQLDDCIQTKWDANGQPGSLICSKKDVHLENLLSDESKTCVAGETIEITVDASITVEIDTLYDLGWFIATDGGDAMEGSSCVVNGLQEKNSYELVDATDSSLPAGEVAWGSTETFSTAAARLPESGSDRRKLFGDDDGGDDDGGLGDDGLGDDGALGDDGGLNADGSSNELGDGDVCGDVFKTSESQAQINIPFIVKKTVLCTDEDEDGNLDVAVCFTWRTDDMFNDNLCTIHDNYPGDIIGSCYCARYNIPNVPVVVPDTTTNVVC